MPFDIKNIYKYIRRITAQFQCPCSGNSMQCKTNQLTRKWKQSALHKIDVLSLKELAGDTS